MALPTSNEEQNIVSLLEACEAALSKTGRTWTILVIENLSSDNTAKCVQEWMESHPNTRIITHESNRVYSGSCDTALKNCRGQFIAWPKGKTSHDFLKLPGIFLDVNTYMCTLAREMKSGARK